MKLIFRYIRCSGFRIKSILKDEQYITGTGTIFSSLKEIGGDGGKYFYVINNEYVRQSRDGTLKCREGFIHVPGNADWDTYDFCVAKYEMSWSGLTAIDITYNRNLYSYYDNGDKGLVVSEPGNSPIAEISKQEAVVECNEIGGHLITNNEWMTIARNIEVQNTNWSSGKVGIGGLWTGVNDFPTYGCAGGKIDSINYGGVTGADSSKCIGERNKLKLSNGEYIYDLAGNLWEYVDNNTSSLGSGLCTEGGEWYTDGEPSTTCQSGYGPTLSNTKNLTDRGMWKSSWC
ncbi:MAG: hypothetical protein Q9M97_01945 [Candidatus Gracilibacteria bacterium]|nr:hypothetical protein [Candidatus Gracilibacteria bacterium]